MYRFILIIFTALLIAIPSYALPSLRGLGAINSTSEPVVDNTFAGKLEQSGQLESALLEWQRIFHDGTHKNMKEHALFKVSYLNCKLGRYQDCLDSFSKLGDMYPQSQYIPEALYAMSIAADKLYEDGGKAFRERLAKNYQSTSWAERAWYAYAWREAMHGKTTSAQGFKAVQELNERVQTFNAEHQNTARTAGSLAAIPGLGHLYLGDWRTALMAIAHIVLFGYAMLYAMRQKHWPYAVIFGLVMAILYVGSIFSAYSLGQRETFEKRMAEMHNWPQPDIDMDTYVPSSNTSFIDGLFWYQRNVIGKFDGERGNGYPVNSLYAKQAMREFGPGYGLLMTVDRLLRDWREIEKPLTRIYADGRDRYVDTLTRNTFWLTDEN